jgi:hypothetical protein
MLTNGKEQPMLQMTLSQLVKLLLKAGWYAGCVTVCTGLGMVAVLFLTENSLLVFVAGLLTLYLALVAFLCDEIKRRSEV